MRRIWHASVLLAAAAAASTFCLLPLASSSDVQKQQEQQQQQAQPQHQPQQEMQPQQHEQQQQQQQQQHLVDCAALEKSKIVPDVIKVRECKSLHLQLHVTFDGKPAGFGAEMPRIETQKPPKVSVSTKPSANTKYVLVMTDPDAPSRESPIYREWAHWVAVSNTDSFDEKSESPLVYRGPSPPKDTGLHRYVFLLFVASMDQQQQQQLLLQQVPGGSSRARWGGVGRAMDFAAANNLQLAAVQWFTAQA